MKEIDKCALIGALFLGGYIVVAPSISLIPSLEPYNEKRALQIGLLLIAGGILLISGTTRRRSCSFL
jgi:putative inorganic carbon (HCO3(-)) transporter